MHQLMRRASLSLKNLVRNQVKNQIGATLIEIIVMASVLAIITMTVMQLATTSFKTKKFASFSQDYAAMMNYLMGVIGNETSCTRALVGPAPLILSSYSIIPMVAIYNLDGSGTVDLQAGSAYKSLKIGSLALITRTINPSVANAVTLKIVFERALDNSGAKASDRISNEELALAVVVNASNRMVSCGPITFGQDKAPAPADFCERQALADKAACGGGVNPSLWAPVNMGGSMICVRVKCPAGVTQNGFSGQFGVLCPGCSTMFYPSP
jgi:hypothetical protein